MAAGTYLALYRRTDKPGLLPAVLQHLEQSREQWGALSVAADGHYADDLVFGFRDKGHCGHWRDDLAVVERDLGVVRRAPGGPGGGRTDTRSSGMEALFIRRLQASI